MVLEGPRTAQCAFATNGINNIFQKRVVFVNSFSRQADHDRRLNKSCKMISLMTANLIGYLAASLRSTL